MVNMNTGSLDELLARGGTEYTGSARMVITSCYFASFGSIGVCLSALGPILLSLAHRCAHCSRPLVLPLPCALYYPYLNIRGRQVRHDTRRTRLPVRRALNRIPCRVCGVYGTAAIMCGAFSMVLMASRLWLMTSLALGP